MIETLRKRSKNPSVNLYLRLMDMDNTSPDIFFMMDEIEDIQILRKYDWSGQLPQYCGTYEVLYKTERYGRFCLIMRRIMNEWKVAPHHTISSGEELETCIVMEYYPGTQGRIFMRGLSEETMQQIIQEYTAVLNRRRRIRRLTAAGRKQKSL